ncbi:MAG: NAD(P)-dependent alcohol dehydrogenase [Deltaproteobacteria bacterium]|nr:NAD(P)-dependent alcohol dehydrogenase [Deltaproteobacteria bacterium]
MRAWELRDAFGLEHLTLVDRQSERLGPGQVRVKLRAAALNYRDLLVARGHYDPRQRLPYVPLSDGVGEVVEVGGDVTRVAVGERVAGCFAQGWIAGEPSLERLRRTLGSNLDGCLREEMVIDAEGVVRVPAQLTDVEAATLPCAGLTAFSALFTLGGLRAGQSVLVLGSGGVSVFALAFARVAGARVIATTSSKDKAERLRALGAEQVLNYREEPAWGRRVRELTGGRGVDLVVEVGGAGTLAQSLKAVRPGGMIALIGVLAGTQEKLNILPAVMKQVCMQGVLVGHRDGFEAMNRAIESSGLRPVVDRVFPFDDAPAAFSHLASGEHFGKVVIEV